MGQGAVSHSGGGEQESGDWSPDHGGEVQTQTLTVGKYHFPEHRARPGWLRLQTLGNPPPLWVSVSLAK